MTKFASGILSGLLIVVVSIFCVSYREGCKKRFNDMTIGRYYNLDIIDINANPNIRKMTVLKLIEKSPTTLIFESDNGKWSIPISKVVSEVPYEAAR